MAGPRAWASQRQHGNSMPLCRWLMLATAAAGCGARSCRRRRASRCSLPPASCWSTSSSSCGASALRRSKPDAFAASLLPVNTEHLVCSPHAPIALVLKHLLSSHASGVFRCCGVIKWVCASCSLASWRCSMGPSPSCSRPTPRLVWLSIPPPTAMPGIDCDAAPATRTVDRGSCHTCAQQQGHPSEPDACCRRPRHGVRSLSGRRLDRSRAGGRCGEPHICCALMCHRLFRLEAVIEVQHSGSTVPAALAAT
jgi:hypothetical protein